jgi:regulator of cell morphogenesis and NO signaling
MTLLTADASLGQLVVEHPGLARVFERLGFDYCCSGRTTLGQACAQKGLEVSDVARELASDRSQRAKEDRAQESMVAPLSNLADQIVAIHHAYLRCELPRLATLLLKVSEAHAGHHPELRELLHVFAGLKEELECHMLKEEMVLFPIIKQLEAETGNSGRHCGSVNHPIHVMEDEHASAGAALQRIRALTDGYTPPSDACASYRVLLEGLAELEADLHRHIHKENNILFPQASELEARQES